MLEAIYDKIPSVNEILSGTCLLAALLASVGTALAVPADAVYVNGKVFTADGNNRVVEAFAVTGDRFKACIVR